MKKVLFIIVMFTILFSLTAEEKFYFSQKGGMLPEGAHQVYLRTNDEFTGFSTLFVGYRYAVNEWFQFSVEAGIGIQVYLGAFHMYFKLYESDDDRFFVGLRTRTGYKYQETELDWFSNAPLNDHRNGIYIAADFTMAWRLGDEKRYVLYYTVYPFFDIDLTGRPVEVYYAPIHLGFEFAFADNPQWSFALETGYFLPINDVPETSYYNFPNLANVGFFYHW